MFYHLGRAGRGLRRLGFVDFVTTIAPGLRDVLLTGKAYEAVGPRRGGRPSYDAVIMDAPPTGRIAQFLNINTEVAGLAKGGPVHKQAESIMRLLRSKRTAVHFVTVLEEMPVQETLDGFAELRAAGLPAGGVVVNQARPVVLPEDRLKRAAQPGGLDPAELEAGLAPVGLADPEVVSALGELATEHAQRVLLEAGQREELAATDAPLYELPLLTDGVDRVGLDLLAKELRRQGAA